MYKYIALSLIVLLINLNTYSQSSNTLKRADALLLSKEYDKALDLADSYLKLNIPKQQKIYAYLIQVKALREKNDLQSLEAVLKELYTIEPSFENAERLIACYMLKRKPHLATELINEIISTKPSMLALNKKAEILIAERNFAEANKIYDEILKNENSINKAIIFYNIGITKYHINSNDDKTAINYFSKANKLDPKFNISLLEIGKIHFIKSRYNQSIDWLKKYMKTIESKKPKHLTKIDQQAYYYLGICYFLLGKDEMAAHNLNLAGNWHKIAKYYKAISNKYVADKTGRMDLYAKANKDIKALQEDNNDPHLKYLLSLILIKEGKEKEAQKVYGDLKKGHSDFTKTDQIIVEAFVNRKDFSDATDKIEEMLEENGDDLYLLVRLSEIYILMEYYEEALDAAKKAVALAPNNAFVQNTLADAYLFMEEDEEAIKVLNNLIKIDKSNEHGLLQRAYIYYENNQSKKSLIDLDNLLNNINPKNTDALVLRGRTYLKIKAKSKACNDLKKAKNLAKSYKNKEMLSNIDNLVYRYCK
jgi:tetratricopeptide (TPR) repeat protein